MGSDVISKCNRILRIVQNTLGFWGYCNGILVLSHKRTIAPSQPAVNEIIHLRTNASVYKWGRRYRWRISERKAASFRVIRRACRKLWDSGRRRSLSGGCARLRAYKITCRALEQFRRHTRFNLVRLIISFLLFDAIFNFLLPFQFLACVCETA